MRIESLDKCQIGDKLARDVYNTQGSLLQKSGANLQEDDIKKFKNHSIPYVYIQDDNLDDVIVDHMVENFKQDLLKNVHDSFSNIISGNYDNLPKIMDIAGNCSDYIFKNKSANVNLFEIKNFDDYTFIHCVDTMIMSGFLGCALGYNKNKVEDLCKSALFHDIGKLKLSRQILDKKAPLTNDEIVEIKKHPIFGADIFKEMMPRASRDIINGILMHHERVDGKGYPFGLDDDKICEFAKIISICDVYTAVSSKRSYRDRFHPNEAYELVLSNSGTMFSSVIVETFRNNFSIYPIGCKIKLSNNIEGYVVVQNQSFPDRPIIRVNYNHVSLRPVPPYDINLLDEKTIYIKSILI